MSKYFTDFIGQKRTKSILGFYLDGYKENKFFPSIFIHATRGSGKTHLMREVGKNLLGENGKPKPFVEVNGASIKKLRSFVDTIIIPFVASEQEATLFIDEIHHVDKTVLNWLLSVLAPTKDNRTKASYMDMEFDFNFHKFTFLSASTNAEKLNAPLKSRLKRVEMEEYVESDLIEILNKNSESIVFKDNVEKEIVNVCRNSPREVVQLSKDVIQYSQQKHNKVFNLKDWVQLTAKLGIRPFGISNSECLILHSLNKRGPQTLTALSAMLGLEPATVRRDLELFLLSKGLLCIDGKRSITPLGQEVLKDC